MVPSGCKVGDGGLFSNPTGILQLAQDSTTPADSWTYIKQHNDNETTDQLDNSFEQQQQRVDNSYSQQQQEFVEKQRQFESLINSIKEKKQTEAVNKASGDTDKPPPLHQNKTNFFHTLRNERKQGIQQNTVSKAPSNKAEETSISEKLSNQLEERLSLSEQLEEKLSLNKQVEEKVSLNKQLEEKLLVNKQLEEKLSLNKQLEQNPLISHYQQQATDGGYTQKVEGCPSRRGAWQNKKTSVPRNGVQSQNLAYKVDVGSGPIIPPGLAGDDGKERGLRDLAVMDNRHNDEEKEKLLQDCPVEYEKKQSNAGSVIKGTAGLLVNPVSIILETSKQESEDDVYNDKFNRKSLLKSKGPNHDQSDSTPRKYREEQHLCPGSWYTCPQERRCKALSWKMCFFCLCLPSCYTCYLTRTIRRRNRHYHQQQQEVDRREQLQSQPGNLIAKAQDNLSSQGSTSSPARKGTRLEARLDEWTDVDVIFTCSDLADKVLQEIQAHKDFESCRNKVRRKIAPIVPEKGVSSQAKASSVGVSAPAKMAAIQETVNHDEEDSPVQLRRSGKFVPINKLISTTSSPSTTQNSNPPALDPNSNPQDPDPNSNILSPNTNPSGERPNLSTSRSLSPVENSEKFFSLESVVESQPSSNASRGSPVGPTSPSSPLTPASPSPAAYSPYPFDEGMRFFSLPGSNLTAMNNYMSSNAEAANAESLASVPAAASKYASPGDSLSSGSARYFSAAGSLTSGSERYFSAAESLASGGGPFISAATSWTSGPYLSAAQSITSGSGAPFMSPAQSITSGSGTYRSAVESLDSARNPPDKQEAPPPPPAVADELTSSDDNRTEVYYNYASSGGGEPTEEPDEQRTEIFYNANSEQPPYTAGFDDLTLEKPQYAQTGFSFGLPNGNGPVRLSAAEQLRECLTTAAGQPDESQFHFRKELSRRLSDLECPVDRQGSPPPPPAGHCCQRDTNDCDNTQSLGVNPSVDPTTTQASQSSCQMISDGRDSLPSLPRNSETAINANCINISQQPRIPPLLLITDSIQEEEDECLVNHNVCADDVVDFMVDEEANPIIPRGVSNNSWFPTKLGSFYRKVENHHLRLNIFKEKSNALTKKNPFFSEDVPNLHIVVVVYTSLKELHIALDKMEGIVPYLKEYWRGYYPLFFIKLKEDKRSKSRFLSLKDIVQQAASAEKTKVTPSDSLPAAKAREGEDDEVKEEEEDVGEGGRLFSRLHRVELDEDNLDVDFVLDSLARYFLHCKVFQCNSGTVEQEENDPTTVLRPVTWSCPGLCKLYSRPTIVADKRQEPIKKGFFKSVRRTIQLRRLTSQESKDNLNKGPGSDEAANKDSQANYKTKRKSQKSTRKSRDSSNKESSSNIQNMAQPPPAEEAGQDVPDHPGLTISHLDKGITEEVHHDNNTAAREEATKELPNEDSKTTITRDEETKLSLTRVTKI